MTQALAKCQCPYYDTPCQRDATQEDLRCDACRSNNCKTAADEKMELWQQMQEAARANEVRFEPDGNIRAALNYTKRYGVDSKRLPLDFDYSKIEERCIKYYTTKPEEWPES
jgi:hypothetical protein